MQFNSETNGLDLYSDARYLLGIDETSDTTSYPIKAFTRNANFALDKYNSLALKADGTWKFNDTNQSNELIDVTQNLVNGTQKYAIQATWLKIGRVRIKDSSRNFVTLLRMDRSKQSDNQLNASSGTPVGYFVLGNYLYLDKAPNYNSTGGLEVQFQQGASYFTYTDTTKTPGWAPQFHRLISLEAALNYALINGIPTRAAALQAMIGIPPDLENNQPGSGMAKEFVDFYSQRDNDAQPTVSFRKSDYGELSLGQNPGSINPKGFPDYYGY